MRRSQRIAATFLALLPVAFAGASSPVTASGFEAATVYREASPSVVLVFAHRGRSTGNSGTGSIVDASGLVLTNSHVVRDPRTDAPYRAIRVYLKPERITGARGHDLKRGYWAHLVAEDRELDLALLRLQGETPALPVLPFGNSETVEIGQSVAAIGHPSGGGLWTLTTGSVSSMRRDGRRDVFQTDAAINPGNSGGPLLDANGRMIGINTFIRRQNAANLPLEGLNYALRSSEVTGWLKRQGFDVAAASGSARATAATTRPAAAGSSASASPPHSASPQAPAAAASPAGSVVANTTPQDRSRPRPFRSVNGQPMFGVPDTGLDLEQLRKESYAKARRNASKAFDELGDEDDPEFDGEFDDADG